MRFQDRIVIVTGAAGGIGSAIGARFASEGARVVVTDVNGEGAEATVERIAAQGGRARAFASNISTAEGCRAIMDSVLAIEGCADDRTIHAVMMVEVVGKSTTQVIRRLRGIPEISSLHTTNGQLGPRRQHGIALGGPEHDLFAGTGEQDALSSVEVVMAGVVSFV